MTDNPVGIPQPQHVADSQGPVFQDPAAGHLRVAAFGDSLMWGQGLDRDRRFSKRFTDQIGGHIGTKATLVWDASRSGAVIKDENSGDREKFADVYPFLFKDAELRKAFLTGETDAPAHGLYGEIPASFPTVLGQVKMLPERAGKLVDVALVTGGINDVDVVRIINPQDSPGRYIEEFDGHIRKIVQNNVGDLLEAVRERCPKAVIMYFGFFPGLSYRSDKSELEELFRHEYNDDFKWWINRNVYNMVNVDKTINEAQTRALWFNGRWQYWVRQQINAMNSDVELRGNGVLFVPSNFNQSSAGLAPNSQLWDDYTLPTQDPARFDRARLIPRESKREAMMKLLLMVLSNDGDAPAEARAMEPTINGPLTMKRDLRDYSNGIAGAKDALIESMSDEIHRIQHGLIASMAHPNDRGALSYTTQAISRYTEHLDLMKKVNGETGDGTIAPTVSRPSGGPVLRTLRRVLARFPRIPGLPGTPTHPGNETPISDTLVKYGLRTQNALKADVTHLNVDSFAVIIKTAPNSSRDLALSASLLINRSGAGGTQRKYLLTFENYVDPGALLSGGNPFNKPYPYLEPEKTNRLTVVATEDQHQLKLKDIVSSALVLGPDPGLELPEAVRNRYGTTWAPDEVTLEVNGVKVSNVQLFGKTFGPNDKVDLKWPKP